MKVIVAGDFCPRYDIVNNLINNGSINPFNSITSVVKQADIAIVNFESTIECPSSPIKKCGPNLRCTRESVSLIKDAGFNVATLANNHIMDYGDDGLKATLSELKANYISTVGAGSNIHEAQKVLYLKAHDKTLGIINCCEHEFSIATSDELGANPLNLINQYNAIIDAKRNADYVIVIVHGGHEMHQLPSVRMQDTYRHFITLGADAVINHHQHCYSGYEIYNGKPIFYGLGNLFFDTENQSQHTSWNEGYMVELSLDEEINFKLIPYIQCVNEYTIQIIKDKTAFESRIKALNDIISDRKQLEKANKDYYLAQSKEFLSIFLPLSNRYIRYAYRKGLIPGIFNKKLLRYILNLVDCEAHRDKLIAILKENTLK